jgi:hypothetical protein
LLPEHRLSQALPALVSCPVCGSARSTVYDDTISQGAWHYCLDCAHSGDMIELAAAAWGVSLLVAAHRLYRTGVPLPSEQLEPAVFSEYLTAYPQHRAKIAELWRQSQRYLIREVSPSLNRLRSRFRLTSQMSVERWLAGPGQFIGGYSYKSIEHIFCPSRAYRPGGPYRVFYEGHWDDVLVIPHHDLPGRICGFLFVGRDGGPRDWVYKRPTMSPIARPLEEAGLGLYWAAHCGRTALGPYLFACADALLAVRLQLRHFATSSTPLPLVSYYAGPRAQTSAAAWLPLSNKTVVLWGWEMTASLVRQAINTNGLISVIRLPDQAQARVDHFVREQEPPDLLRKILKRAKPWRDALRVWVDHAPDGEVEELLIHLAAAGASGPLLRGISPRLDAFVNAPPVSREVTFCRRCKVVEHNDRWWIKGTATLHTSIIMNATLRLETFYDENDQESYKGIIVYAGESFTFVVTVKRFTMPFLRNFLRQVRPDATLFVAPRWQIKSLVILAMAFSASR